MVLKVKSELYEEKKKREKKTKRESRLKIEDARIFKN